jgi:hypothetical protein
MTDDERDNPGILLPPPLTYLLPLVFGLLLDRRFHLPFLPRSVARTLQHGPQLLTQRTSVRDDAYHEALLRRPTHKDRPGHRRRDVQVVRSCSPLRREPLLRQALLEDRPASSVASAEEGRRKATQDRPDRGETPRRGRRRGERPAATVSERRRYLERATGKALSDSTVKRLLKRLGFSRKNGLLWGRWSETNG